MIKSTSFWEDEKDIPLLVLNNKFLENQGDKIIDRVAKWPALAQLAEPSSDLILAEVENPDRILIADAARTFSHEDNRKQFVKLLFHLNTQFKDYAQGLGYVSSFFLLTMSEPQIIALLSQINSHERYIPGYWKHEAIKFATDAYVFLGFLRKFHPDVAAHLQAHTVDPATFCQKWFVGLCVHVLPLEYLFTFFEKFLVQGFPFLMKFGLALVKNMKKPLLEANNASALFAILRLDPKAVPHEAELLSKILEDTDLYDLSKENFETLRKEAYDKHLKKRVETAHAVLDKADVIEDCVLCKDDFPEFHCIECNINVSILLLRHTSTKPYRV